jgi:hypothetical protein
MTPPLDPARIAFLRVERALRPLSDAERRRVIRSIAILLDYPEATGDSPNA